VAWHLKLDNLRCEAIRRHAIWWTWAARGVAAVFVTVEDARATETDTLPEKAGEMQEKKRC
jgi:hypothetical protein